MKDPRHHQKKVRIKSVGGDNLPALVRALHKWYSDRCSEGNLCSVRFDVPELPLSLNHQNKRVNLPKKGGGFYQGAALRPEVHTFRQLVMLGLGYQKAKWNPTGVTAALVLFYSPTWLTKKLTVREEDVDNKVKPVFDAVQECTWVPDELHWQFHAFKIPSKKTKTVVYLFDLGDVVEYYD